MYRVGTALLLLALATTPTFAQFSRGQSNPDPYIVTEAAGAAGYRDINAKTLVTSTIISPCVLIIAGQSNVANNVTSVYTPSNTTVYNLNLYDGAIYKAVDPLLGPSAPTTLGSGNFAGRLADKIINSGANCQNVVLVPIGVDATTVAQWVSTYSNRLTAAFARISARGMTTTAILWGQGEQDHGTSQSSYTNSLTSLIGVSRSAGYNGPWFIAEETWAAGTIDSSVQAAQLAIVNHSSGIWAGPNADSLDATNRQSDNTHWNNTGSDAYAGLWQSALHAFGAPF